MTDAFIFDAARSPRGKGNKGGALHEVTAVSLSADMLDSIVSRNELEPDAVEDVIWGNVTQIGEQGGCIARASVLLSSLDMRVPGLTINRFCASGLEAVSIAADRIAAGDGDSYIAGGVEMMSRVSIGSDGAALAVDPLLAIDKGFVPQGISADMIATDCGLSRADCDSYAVASQRRAARAWNDGHFRNSVVPVTDINGLVLLDRDEHMRPGTDVQALSELKPAFRELGEGMPGFDKVAMIRFPHLGRIDHVHHAGNSSGIVDGAAAVLLGSASFGKRFGLAPRARIRSIARIGSDPTIMLTGPLPATRKALERAGMGISDIDLFEVNEAFAAIPLLYMKEFDLDHSMVNVNGGAIAMGHPLGATGAMLLGTALDELERASLGVALVTLCVAGGMGIAMIIERV